MSIAQNPLFGPMRKSMGNFTTMSNNGQNIIRSKSLYVKRKHSEAQQIQIQKMILLAKVYRNIGGIAVLGFAENSKGVSPYNRFIAVNFKSAFDPATKVPVVSYPLLLVSKGTLPAVKVSGADVESEGIRISYTSDTAIPLVSVSDQLIAFALTTRGELRICKQVRGTEEAGYLLIPLPGVEVDKVVCCYVFARSADGKKASDSVYVAL
jgi:hypothetical protein